jgi:lipopolysaccharide/colanic/teichoic acid biosynthesis glycosyltransferase
MSRLIKHIADRLIAAIALLLLSPLMIIIAILVWSKLGSPILFTQPRPGKDSRIFTFYKFRTMTDARDSQGNLLTDGDRLTPFGSWLRKISLDELPQLLNVLKGDMSLIGPRPLLVSFLDFYNPEQMRRHEILPGITGFAQINGRNNVSWEKRFQMDIFYVDNWSLWLDLKILLATIAIVVKQKDVNQKGHVTCENFDDYMLRTRPQNYLITND